MWPDVDVRTASELDAPMSMIQPRWAADATAWVPPYRILSWREI